MFSPPPLLHFCSSFPLFSCCPRLFPTLVPQVLLALLHTHILFRSFARLIFRSLALSRTHRQVLCGARKGSLLLSSSSLLNISLHFFTHTPFLLLSFSPLLLFIHTHILSFSLSVSRTDTHTLTHTHTGATAFSPRMLASERRRSKKASHLRASR